MAPTELRQGNVDRATIVDQLSVGGKISLLLPSIVVSELFLSVFAEN